VQGSRNAGGDSLEQRLCLGHGPNFNRKIGENCIRLARFAKEAAVDLAAQALRESTHAAKQDEAKGDKGDSEGDVGIRAHAGGGNDDRYRARMRPIPVVSVVAATKKAPV